MKITHPLIRFENKYTPEPNSGCWLWIGGMNNQGYGMFYNGQKYQLAHRFSYTVHKGPIDHGMHILHKCDNPACVNPAHLVQGTQYDNMRDMVRKRRSNRGEDRPNASVTETDVKVIKYLIDKNTITYSNIAKIFNVTESVVVGIATGDTWKHVTSLEDHSVE